MKHSGIKQRGWQVAELSPALGNGARPQGRRQRLIRPAQLKVGHVQGKQRRTYQGLFMRLFGKVEGLQMLL